MLVRLLNFFRSPSSPLTGGYYKIHLLGLFYKINGLLKEQYLMCSHYWVNGSCHNTIKAGFLALSIIYPATQWDCEWDWVSSSFYPQGQWAQHRIQHIIEASAWLCVNQLGCSTHSSFQKRQHYVQINWGLFRRMPSLGEPTWWDFGTQSQPTSWHHWVRRPQVDTDLEWQVVCSHAL